jgi:hypothetical protein
VRLGTGVNRFTPGPLVTPGPRGGSPGVRGRRRGLAGTYPRCWGSAGAAGAGPEPTTGSRLLQVWRACSWVMAAAATAAAAAAGGAAASAAWSRRFDPAKHGCPRPFMGGNFAERCSWVLGSNLVGVAPLNRGVVKALMMLADPRAASSVNRPAGFLCWL